MEGEKKRTWRINPFLSWIDIDPWQNECGQVPKGIPLHQAWMASKCLQYPPMAKIIRETTNNWWDEVGVGMVDQERFKDGCADGSDNTEKMGVWLDGVLEDLIFALMIQDRGQRREDFGCHGQGEVRFKSTISPPQEMMHIGRVQWNLETCLRLLVMKSQTSLPTGRGDVAYHVTFWANVSIVSWGLGIGAGASIEMLTSFASGLVWGRGTMGGPRGLILR